MKKKREIPTLEELIRWNEKINRRLYFNSKGNIIDSRGRLIDATPLYGPRVLSVPRTYHSEYMVPGFDEERPWMCDINHHCAYLTKEEVMFVLGYDYSYKDPQAFVEVKAMLEAADSGPKNANAYALSDVLEYGIHCERGFEVIPVQYYRIDPRRHRQLSLRGKELIQSIIYLDKTRNDP